MKNIKDHLDYKNTKKYHNIAKKTSQKLIYDFKNLAELLPEGFDPKKIQLNDLLQFISNKDGIEGLNRAKRAIQIHHEYGVGKKATGGYQLLREDLNLLANKTTNLIESGDPRKVKKGAAEETSTINFLITHKISYHSLMTLRSHHIFKLMKELGETRANATVKKYINILCHAWRVAKKEWGINLPAENPCAMVTMPKVNDARDRIAT